MRPLKISREALLQTCASTFKRHGYHGTTMDMLATACGLTKASFYHHYPNKESLLRDVLETTHHALKTSLFAIAYDDAKTPAERLTQICSKAQKLFQDGTIGCLMGVVAIDASYASVELMAPIRAFMDDWAQAFAHILAEVHDEARALQLGRQLVADYEGAILLARIYQDASLLDALGARTLGLLQPTG